MMEMLIGVDEMKANSIKIQYPEDSNEMEIVLSMARNNETIQKVSKLREVTEKDKLLKVDIKQYRRKRSLNANAYCFILCSKIAEKIGNTKELVYKQAINDVGQFEIVPIREDALKRWIGAWESKGLGWQSEIMRDSKIEGYVNTINYFGSSVYNTKDMSLLLEEIVFQAKELDIDTITENEKKDLISKRGER